MAKEIKAREFNEYLDVYKWVQEFYNFCKRDDIVRFRNSYPNGTAEAYVAEKLPIILDFIEECSKVLFPLHNFDYGRIGQKFKEFDKMKGGLRRKKLKQHQKYMMERTRKDILGLK